MVLWNDPFTGVQYKIDEGWASKVQQHLAEMLGERLQKVKDAKEAADRAASFWWNYYELIFPLRFGKKQDVQGLIHGRSLFEEAEEVDLEESLDQELRTRFLDDLRLPPLLPSQTKPDELVPDHHLTCAAITNVVLRAQGVEESLLHAVRLGILLHELSEEEPLRVWLQAFPQAWSTARFLCGEGEPPEGVEGDVLRAIHEGEKLEILQAKRVYLVALGAQRVKQFVFETPGLNEIRGASTLLDQCVEDLKRSISDELGPEVVLRAAASTLEFLAPADANAAGEKWTKWLRTYFYERTGTAFPAAAVHAVSPGDLLTRFHEVMRPLYRRLEQDRYRATLPRTETLPFELRCDLCRTRPAEGWYRLPEGEPAPACRVCFTKREVGRPERAGKVREVLDWLGLTNPEPLKVQGKQPEEYTASDLEQLIPSSAERKRIAVIYGDGNNFGAIVQKLESLSLSLQWTHRVEKTTKAAVALALARATQEARQEQELQKLPFQVLALGGDDLSLLTWGSIGLRFCEQFLHLTDKEFQQGKGKKLSDKPISFSLGALFCDEKAPVRRTVDFAENELLKWAKRAVRRQQKGNVAFLLAVTAEQIPADLEVYRSTMFIRHGKLCLTLRPFTAEELRFLLDKAIGIIRGHHTGRLHRLVESFIQSPPLVAFLHYIYQKKRERNKGVIHCIETPREEWEPLWQDIPLPASPLRRPPFGEGDQQGGVRWFSPLWDLLEIVKILE